MTSKVAYPGSAATLATSRKGSEKRVGAQKRLLKFGLIFLAIAAVIIGTVGYLNYRLDPLTFNSAEQAKAAAALANGRSIAIPHSNIDWRELRREHIRQMKETPDIIIFGGSRWQEATSAVAPDKRVYNAFVSNDHFEDMMALTELLYSTKHLPKTLVLSVRFSTFEYLDRREAWWWKSFGPEYRTMAERLKVEAHPWWNTLPTGKWLHLLSAETIVDKLKHDDSISRDWRSTGALSDPAMDIVGPDGALRFSEQHLKTYTPDFAEHDALRRATVDRTKRLKIDPVLLSQLRTLLIFLKEQGVQTALIQTPFHPAYYSAIKGSGYFDDLMQIETDIHRIAEETGAVVRGSFDATREGCDRNDYRDFNHSRVECLSRLIAQLPENTGR
jgi:hypothetical protein